MNNDNQVLVVLAVTGCILLGVGVLSVMAGALYFGYRKVKVVAASWDRFSVSIERLSGIAEKFEALPDHTKALGLAATAIIKEVVTLRVSVKALVDTVSVAGQARSDKVPALMEYDEEEADLTVKVQAFLDSHPEYDKDTATDLVRNLGIE